MYMPQGVLSMFYNPFPIVSLPLERPPLSFDLAGAAGLFGGDEVVSGLTTVHVYGGWRSLGWYNSPGSFQVSKRLNQVAMAAPFPRSKSDFKSIDIDPTTLLGLDASKGPRFRAAHSGTIMEETSYIATLFAKECMAWESEGRVVSGRRSQAVSITIANLGNAPPYEIYPARGDIFTLISASIPIVTSIGACAICAACEDWYASGLILLGIVASGVSGFILGSARFAFVHPEPAKGSPPGDGILTAPNTIILLRGSEAAVNSITRGKFSLRFTTAAHYHLLQSCSILFFIQSICQLLLVPQASLFGQIMFLISLGVSALYNVWLSNLDKEKIHRKMLFQRVLQNPTLSKYTLGTRTSAVVFTLLALKLKDPTALLNELLPNDTPVWRQWKKTVLEWLRDPNDQAFQSCGNTGDLDVFTQQEKDLLDLLLEDARSAYRGCREYFLVE